MEYGVGNLDNLALPLSGLRRELLARVARRALQLLERLREPLDLLALVAVARAQLGTLVLARGQRGLLRAQLRVARLQHPAHLHQRLVQLLEPRVRRPKLLHNTTIGLSLSQAKGTLKPLAITVQLWLRFTPAIRVYSSWTL